MRLHKLNHYGLASRTKIYEVCSRCRRLQARIVKLAMERRTPMLPDFWWDAVNSCCFATLELWLLTKRYYLQSYEILWLSSCIHHAFILPDLLSLTVLSKAFITRAKRNLSLFMSFPGRKIYRYIGRYRPPPRRMLGRPIRKFRSRLFARKRCEKIAKSGRYRAFALRYGRYCYVARLTSRKFIRYGRSRTRSPSALKVFIRTSGMSSNEYYMLIYFAICTWSDCYLDLDKTWNK